MSANCANVTLGHSIRANVTLARNRGRDVSAANATFGHSIRTNVTFAQKGVGR
jgi:hypothetical protein